VAFWGRFAEGLGPLLVAEFLSLIDNLSLGLQVAAD
jgi:hypothetical protein